MLPATRLQTTPLILHPQPRYLITIPVNKTNAPSLLEAESNRCGVSPEAQRSRSSNTWLTTLINHKQRERKQRKVQRENETQMRPLENEPLIFHSVSLAMCTHLWHWITLRPEWTLRHLITRSLQASLHLSLRPMQCIYSHIIGIWPLKLPCAYLKMIVCMLQ